MKIFLQTLFFFLLVSQICFSQPVSPTASQGGWYQQNSGTTANLNAVDFIDANNGFVVGNSGIILRTTDAGSHWITQNSGTNYRLCGVSFTDLNTGTVVGNDGSIWNGIILRTTDGGENWIAQNVSNIGLYGVSFSDANNGIAVGQTVDTLSGWYGGAILRTTNGGQHWTTQQSGIIRPLSSVTFVDANKGIAVGDGIIRTTDGGQNWVTIVTGQLLGGYLSAVSLSDANNGIAVGGSAYNGIICRTTNGGEDWISRQIGLYPFGGVSSMDANNATVVGVAYSYFHDGIILRTTDGGENWINQSSGTNQALCGVSFTDAINGTVVGANGTILRTTNGGNPVPVELNSFTATANGKVVTLNWSKATELNNYGFEIQRKVFGGDFATVAFVKGQGTTTQQNQYSFADKNLDEGKYFYRLKQMDYGGQFSYSQIVEVDVRMLNKYSLEQNYPNPFNPTTTIGFGIPASPNPSKGGALVTLKVYDILGNEVKTLVNKEIEAGYHSIDFNASDLPSGVYFYQLLVSALQSKDGKAGSFVETKKMLLLR